MYIQVLAVIGFVAVASAADVTVGVEGGRVIFDQNVTANPTFWTLVRNLTVSINSTDEVISQVVVTDNRAEKNGEAKIVEGGVGEKNVTIELKGPAVFRGFDFTVQVFASQDNVEGSAQHSKLPEIETQNPQVPYSKDVNVNDDANEGQKNENRDDVILGASTPAISSTTAKDDTQQQNDNQAILNNPTLVGKDDQIRQYRNTQDQKTKVPLPTLFKDTEIEKTKESTPVPALTNDEEGDENQTLNIVVGQEKYATKVIPLTIRTSTASSEKITTTEASKLHENVKSLKQ